MHKLNKKRSYFVRIIKTGEVLGYYRTFVTARFSLSQWKYLTYEKCEVVKNEQTN